MKHRKFTIDLSTDHFYQKLIDAAKEMVRIVYLGGPSVLSRILGLEPPEIETILLDDKNDINNFIQFHSDGECFTIKNLRVPEFKQVAFADKVCFLNTIQNYERTLSTDIEGLLIDVCSMDIVDLIGGKGFNALDTRTVTLSDKSYHFPELFWNAIETLCYLPNFSFEAKDINTDLMFFLNPNSEDYLKTPPGAGAADWIPSYGSRFLTSVLTKIAELPYFPYHVIKDYIVFFNAQFDPGVDLHLPLSDRMFSNHIYNQSSLKIGLSPAAKLAIIFMPIFQWSITNRDRSDALLKQMKKHPDFDSFCKLHLVEYDICHFFFWFLFSMYCFQTPIGFDVMRILFSYSNLARFNFAGEWALYSGPQYWKPALSFMAQQTCEEALQSINKDGTFEMLSKNREMFSNNELARANGLSNTWKANMVSLYGDLYQWLKANPGKEFRDYVEAKKTMPRNFHRKEYAYHQNKH